MDVKQRAAEILAGMSLQEKLGQLKQIYIRYDNVEAMKEEIRQGNTGAVILSAHAFPCDGDQGIYREVVDSLQKTAVEESPSKIPLLFSRDVIHGHKVVHPIPLAMTASFNFDLIEQAYACAAEEALQDGINWTYAPMVDLSRDPRWGRVIEGPGEDPYLGGEFAKAAVKGFQGTKQPYRMAACAKHFIGYGASEGGRDYHRTEISDYSLRNFYTNAFGKAVQADVLTVMNSFNEINGQPTASSKYYLTDILRGELGFEGFVVSDAGAVNCLTRQGVAKDKKEAARLALNAGLDMELDRKCYEYLPELLEEGAVTEDTVNTAVLRILEAKLKLGLFENPYAPRGGYDRESHMDVARKLAGESAVLLKNKDNILPLQKDRPIALYGPYVHNKRDLLGSWTIDFEIDFVTTIGEAIGKVATNVREPSSLRYGLIKDYDTVVLALGEPFGVTGEGHSMADIALDSAQAELVHQAKRLGKKVICLITAGRPLNLSSIADEADAIVYLWHSGTQTGLAAADVLFGDVCPSGRLPMSFPRATGQIPIYYNCPPSGQLANGYYSNDTKKANYEDVLSTPLYPFGYGLSYTEFSYSPVTAEKETFTLQDLQDGIMVSATVTNVGACQGKEVVQMYVRDVCSGYTRPLKELKGAEKVLLQPGESATVSFSITEETLGYFTPQGEFSVEKGRFVIFIGHDSYTENAITVDLV